MGKFEYRAIASYRTDSSQAFTLAVCTVHLIAAIHGELGQHQAIYPNGEPILDDPRFIIYEKVRSRSTARDESGTRN
jgi:hypothetical protein